MRDAASTHPAGSALGHIRQAVGLGGWADLRPPTAWMTKLRQIARGLWLATAMSIVVGASGWEHVTASIAVAVGLAALTIEILARRSRSTIPGILAGLAVVGALAAILALTVVQVAIPFVVVVLAAVTVSAARRIGIASQSAVVLALIVLPFVFDTIRPTATAMTMAATYFVLVRPLLVIGTLLEFLHRQHSVLFDQAPVALLEQDWTESMAYLATDSAQTSEDLRRRLEADPGLATAAVTRMVALRANAAAAELLGAPPSKILGPIDEERATGRTVDMWVERILSVWDGRPGTLDYDFLDYAGESKWVTIENIAVGAHNHRIIVSATDITASRRENADLEYLVDAKDEFIAAVSHKVRTPLTAVVGLTDELVSSGDFSEHDRRELLTIISHQAHEISYLVEDLLVGGRSTLEQLSLVEEDFDVAAEIAEMLTTLGYHTPVDSLGAHPHARADRLRVRQIVRNLVVNAVDHGGTDHRIIVGGADHPFIEVRDTGPALSDASLSRLFEAYGREGTSEPESVGLGLAVSRRLAEAMGGTLEYDHDGTEAIFRLGLPPAS